MVERAYGKELFALTATAIYGAQRYAKHIGYKPEYMRVPNSTMVKSSIWLGLVVAMPCLLIDLVTVTCNVTWNEQQKVK